MDRLDTLDAFELHDQLVLHQQINPIPTIEAHTFVLYRQRMLRYEADFVTLKLMSETPLICRFQQPRPEYAVHLNGTANYPV